MVPDHLLYVLDTKRFHGLTTISINSLTDSPQSMIMATVADRERLMLMSYREHCHSVEDSNLIGAKRTLSDPDGSFHARAYHFVSEKHTAEEETTMYSGRTVS